MERNSAAARDIWTRQNAWQLLNFLPFPVGQTIYGHCTYTFFRSVSKSTNTELLSKGGRRKRGIITHQPTSAQGRGAAERPTKTVQSDHRRFKWQRVTKRTLLPAAHATPSQNHPPDPSAFLLPSSPPRALSSFVAVCGYVVAV